MSILCQIPWSSGRKRRAQSQVLVDKMKNFNLETAGWRISMSSTFPYIFTQFFPLCMSSAHTPIQNWTTNIHEKRKELLSRVKEGISRITIYFSSSFPLHEIWWNYALIQELDSMSNPFFLSSIEETWNIVSLVWVITQMEKIEIL